MWRMGEESRWPGTLYVVFPGNVGDDETVCEAVSALVGAGQGELG